MLGLHYLQVISVYEIHKLHFCLARFTSCVRDSKIYKLDLDLSIQNVYKSFPIRKAYSFSFGLHEQQVFFWFTWLCGRLFPYGVYAFRS